MTQQPTQPTRRTVVTGAAAGVAATAAGVVTAAPATAAGNKNGQVTLTVLGTSDTHGNVYNWDYYHERRVRRQQRTTTSASPSWPP